MAVSVPLRMEHNSEEIFFQYLKNIIIFSKEVGNITGKWVEF